MMGLRLFRSSPVTVFLVFINCLVAISISVDVTRRDTLSKTIYGNSGFLNTHGQVYTNYVLKSPDRYSPTTASLAARAEWGGDRDRQWMARISMRDPAFVSELKSRPNRLAQGLDPVAQRYWGKNIAEFIRFESDDIFDDLGLNWLRLSTASDFGSVFDFVGSLMTYQFAHSGILHLMLNMWFLIIFGTWAERRLGPIAYLGFYIFCGVFGAISFLAWSTPSATPLVGASAAVSGLMGLTCALLWNQRIRFLFWFFPIKGYFGFLKLPSQVAVGMWLLGDLAGHFSQSGLIGGVAHTAHIGGFLMGLLSGFALQRSVFDGAKNSA